MEVVARVAAWLSVLAGLTAVAPVMQAQPRADVAAVKKQLVGAYKLVGYVNYDANGGSTPSPFTIGQIYYDAAGRMSAQLMRPDRAKLPAQQASEAERAAAYSSFISYFGRYEIDAEKRTVTHHVEGGMSPNMVGAALVRHFEFSPDGKSLFLSVKSGDRVTGRLQWDRY
jgi:hypothetical protein